MELHPEDVPLAIEDWNDLIRRSQTFVDGQADVQALELLGQDVHGHAVVTPELLVSDETAGSDISGSVCYLTRDG